MIRDLLTENQIRKTVEKTMNNNETSFTVQEILDSGVIPELKGFKVQSGKVSDSIYGGMSPTKEFENPVLVTADGIPIRFMVRGLRISTHDIIRGEIPFKDQVLAVNHNFMRGIVSPYIGTSQYDIEGLGDNSIVIAAENLTQIPIENVLRAYNAKSSTTTSLYQAYTIRGEREFCGHSLPEGIITNGILPYVMDTPSTKSETHDNSVTPEYLFENGICTKEQYVNIRNSSIAAFGAASQFLRSKGIILVDTKIEHGINKNGIIVSQDELLTMDSSRYWIIADYIDQLILLKEGKISELNPKAYSKEFARGFSEGDRKYTDEQRIEIAVRYIMGIQMITGQRFEFDLRSREERIISGINTAVKTLAKTR